MDAIAIIPARYASTRLPGKPLLDETGKPLIRHVVEAVAPARRIERVVVATDDQRIADAVTAFGGEAVMTRPDHASGTDRLAEAAELLGLDDDRIVVNVQGDEPDIPAETVDALVELLESSDAPMATLAAPLAVEEVDQPSRVKVVFTADGYAMYFSRSVIPYDREGHARPNYYLHLGLYAYRAGFLREFTQLPPTPIEQAERLEQLRALEHGRRIAIRTVTAHGRGIDTPEDYIHFVARMAKRTDSQ